ncbi:MAG: dimethylaniline monooxygenase, partial [Frondihabitans sp.]|nr:dimethylaniline monooxygenase [Frondihabitans sp.]
MSSHSTTARQTVCVIGAGAAGLAALKNFSEAGYDVMAYEASEFVGGLWNFGYRSLHLITAKDLCSYDGFPIPDEFPMFPHRDQIVAYFNSYADHFGIREKITFRTRVVAVEPVDVTGLAGWNVTTDAGETRRFDTVVISNGHLSTPIVPTFPGTFTGKLFHSHDYRAPDDFDGDRILVVGSGNSGCDIAVDAVQEHLTTAIVIRKGQVFQPKTLAGRGRTQLPIGFLPPKLRERIMRFSIRLAYGTSRDYPGLPAPETENVDKNPGVVNTQVLHWIHHGRLAVRPGISNIDGKLVTFEDGTVEEYDTIVAATGYTTELPFLRKGLVRWEHGHPLRYAEGTTFPHLAGLHVIGLVGPTGAQWPVYDRQSRAILRLMRLQRNLN